MTKVGIEFIFLLGFRKSQVDLLLLCAGEGRYLLSFRAKPGLR
jgi:hypothetical protein